MRRRLFLIACTPWLVSASDPVAVAAREAQAAVAEQQRLEREAQGAKSQAERAAADSAAAGQALIATEARIAAGEAELAALQRRREGLAAQLAAARRPASALLAGLAEAGRKPAWLSLVGAGNAEQQVRLAALARTVGPEVERRSSTLKGQLATLATLERRQRDLQAQLGRDRLAAAEAQQRFADKEKAALALASQKGAQAFVAADQVLDRSERTASLQGEAEQRRAALKQAAVLAKLPPSAPRPTAPEGGAPVPPIAWQVPAGGAVTAGLGELMSNGVRARGVTIAAVTGTQVVAPAAGRIVFAGPFRRRPGLVIIDHGGGWVTLLGNVRPSLRVGDRIAAGDPVGRALGPVTAELFRDGKAEPAALIARSSG
ncbi:hypothetical protein GCM10022281_12890 [Sphingomonas rosea]|uniref:M23ase beta-sheet core domain-containing protein n=1 Tax=Sphingomonas rosea TaxID=335605 RepID=A0ABP7U0Q5_9SPHN